MANLAQGTYIQLGLALAADGPSEAKKLARSRALSEVVENESGRLLPAIRGWLRDQNEAEDVLQDVFEEFVESYDLDEVIESLGAWLMTVARNKVFDRFRRKKTQSEYRDKFLTELSAQGATEAATNSGPEEEFERKNLQLALRQAIALLPEEQREVFVRHELEGQSFEEMAKQLDVNINTLLSRKRYAVQFLREHLKEYENGTDE